MFVRHTCHVKSMTPGRGSDAVTCLFISVFCALLVETVVQSMTESSVVAQWLRPEGAIQTTGHSSQRIQIFMCVSVCFNLVLPFLFELILVA